MLMFTFTTELVTEAGIIWDTICFARPPLFYRRLS